MPYREKTLDVIPVVPPTAIAWASWMAEIEPIITVVGSVLSVAFAVWYYWEKIKLTRKQSKKLDEPKR